MILNYSCFDGFYYCFDELWHCHIHSECVHFHSSTHGYVLLVQEKTHDYIVILILQKTCLCHLNVRFISELLGILSGMNMKIIKGRSAYYYYFCFTQGSCWSRFAASEMSKIPAQLVPVLQS